MKVIDYTKAVTQHFLEKSFKKLYIFFSRKTQKLVFSECCVLVFYVSLCCSVCWFLYGTFCHGALKVVIHVEIPKAAPKSPFVIFKIRDDIEMK